MITNQIAKLSKNLAQGSLSFLSRVHFANLKVKIDYCKGCESKQMVEIVEKELYNQYRRTFGDHTITIDSNKSYEYDGRFIIDLKINDQENQRIWDNRRQGDIFDDNVDKITQIIESKLQELKQKGK